MENNAQKLIHYCWFGGKSLPKSVKKAIASWKKYLPDFTIKQWDESNFDIQCNAFCAEAYKQKKWAFVADVARCYALREYGGLYFDTDMFVTKNVDDILDYGFVAGWESDYNVAAGVLWVKNAHNDIIEQLWDYYCTHSFDAENVFGFSIPILLTGILQKEYGLEYFRSGIQDLRNNTRIYPRDYFYPIPSDNSPQMFTENTCMVHYYLGSWLPENEKKRIVFRLKFGRRLGDFLLDFLVKAKGIARGVGKIVLYPLRKAHSKKATAAFLDNWIADFEKRADKLHNPEYIAFYNKNWFGTSIATKDLFTNTIGIEALHYPELREHIARYVASSGAKLVIFSAFSVGWDLLIKEIHKLDPAIKVKVLWHGSLALNVEDYDWYMLETLLRYLKAGEIVSLGLVKKSLYEFLYKKGYSVEFVANSVILPEKVRHRTVKSETDAPLRIGLMASGDRWLKNFHTQLAAASLFQNASVICIPLNAKTVIMSKHFGINLTGSYTNIPREKMLNLLGSNSINLYATFTECAPLLPLESLEMGVPCLTGNNHHYWQGTELEKYLVVDRVDDCNEIYRKAKACLEHRNEILALYEQWRLVNAEFSRKTVDAFLRCAF